MPKYQKEYPKNAWRYFHPSYDEAFKKKHPVKYGILAVCGIVALLLPLTIVTLVAEVWYPAPDSGFKILTIVGGFIIGIGLFNIVAAWIGQYLGHWVTVGCLLLGGAILAVSLVILYVPDIYASFDEAMVSYYFGAMLFNVLIPIFYLPFRFAVGSWLKRKGMSKKRIKGLKKGAAAFWWYEQIHKEVDLGLIYYANKLVTIIYPIELGLGLIFGWVRFLTPVISGLYVIISIVIAGMWLFSLAQEKIDTYGTPVVIFRWTKKHGVASSLFDLVQAAFLLMAGYAHILIMLDALNIPR
ncbi:MAG: hypothetical protein IJW45_09130 [Oscillospiraceae bacterium]|nr:hypothetical protein [Oscillospiraceae bacterium]